LELRTTLKYTNPIGYSQHLRTVGIIDEVSGSQIFRTNTSVCKYIMRYSVFELLILGNTRYVVRILGMRMANTGYHYGDYRECAWRN